MSATINHPRGLYGQPVVFRPTLSKDRKSIANVNRRSWICIRSTWQSVASMADPRVGLTLLQKGPTTMNSSPWNFTRLVRPLLLMLVMTVASASYAGLFISVTVAPPPLPIYVQPPCPEPGFIWIPGYWAWGDEGYYWLHCTWVPATQPGYYWTPGYWGWNEGIYLWNDGYWGPHVGYYGGVNYGFGYFGLGFVGGEWHGRDFYYNRAVVNVNTTRITNVYVNRTVIVNNYSNN